MSRPRHPDKHIEHAIQHAESLGWVVELSRGHAWGSIRCPRSSRDGCIVWIWSTPRNPESHARRIVREINACDHKDGPIIGAEETGDDHSG